MNNKFLWGGILGIIIIVFGVSFWYNRGLSTGTTGSGSSGVADREVKLSDQEKEATVLSTPIPTPTFAPYFLQVEDINDSFIILVNEKGSNSRLSNNPSKVKVFRQKGNELIPALLSDVKKGQQVIVKPVIPGKESHLILL